LAHVGYFFGAFVYEEDDEVALWVVFGYGIGYVFE
jgi:hypothetical protein